MSQKSEKENSKQLNNIITTLAKIQDQLWKEKRVTTKEELYQIAVIGSYVNCLVRAFADNEVTPIKEEDKPQDDTV